MFPPQQSPSVDLAALSGICGSISIACWVVVFSPQIIENFRRSSAEGLSMTFLVIWLAGDVFNILGGVLQGILPTMIILAIYYTLADIVLIAQVFYYRGFSFRDPKTAKANGTVNGAIHDEPETRPLLHPDNPSPSQEEHHYDATHLSPRHSSAPNVHPEPTPKTTLQLNAAPSNPSSSTSPPSSS